MYGKYTSPMDTIGVALKKMAHTGFTETPQWIHWKGGAGGI